MEYTEGGIMDVLCAMLVSLSHTHTHARTHAHTLKMRLYIFSYGKHIYTL